MSTYDTHLTALAGAAQRFDDVLRSGDRAAPVPSCPGWSVEDLGVHLTDVHRWALGQLTGSEPAPLAHDDLADRFRTGADELVAALRARSSDTPCSAIYPPDTAATWARRQAHETAIHLWDAQRALGVEPGLPVELATDGVREVVGDLYPRQVRLGRIAALARTVVFAFSDAPGEASLDGADGGDAAVIVTGRAEDVLLLLWKRRALVEVALTIDGERAALDAALATRLVP